MCGCGYLVQGHAWNRQLVDGIDEFLFVVTLFAHAPNAPVDPECLRDITLHIDEFEPSP